MKQNTILVPTGVVGIVGGLLVLMTVLGLKHFFGYPDIIRAEPGIIMQKLHAMRHVVPYIYYFGFGGAGFCMILFAMLFGKLLNDSGEEILSSIGKVSGIVAGVLLFVGIIRYTILFPELAAMREAGVGDPAVIDVIFTVMNLYAGESVAEHAQFTFASFMYLFFGLSLLKAGLLPRWVAFLGILTAVVIWIGNLEQFGFDFAFAFNRTAAKLMALWLFCAGLVLVLKARKKSDTTRLNENELSSQA